MARYPSRSYRRRRGRNRRRIYIVSALLLLVLVYIVYRIARRETPNPSQAAIAAEAEEQITTFIPKPVPEPNLSDIPQATSESDPQVTAVIAEAARLLEGEPAKITEARDRLNELLPMPMSQQQQRFVKNKLARLADKWLFSRTVLAGDNLCKNYKVGHGDQLSVIGRRHKVPYEILMQLNGIKSPEKLQAGHVIKVINGPFHARIYRSSFTMDLYLQNTFVRSFPVGLGRPGHETPTGLWLVKPDGKIIRPTWRDPDTGKVYKPDDPDYPLGSRWIALEGLKGDAVGRTGFALHGTKDPEQIGTAGSRGCIRLFNGDAILMYNLLAGGVSQVEVVD